MPEIGQTLSHYKIVEKIGQGGMGEVYLADDTTLDRKVALKFLPDAFTSDPERMARFEREAKLLASLNHSNIAGIYGLEQADGNRFLVLEYVEGETLQARLSKGALPLEDALTLCRQIAEGLEAAHEKGVIHRDLKPANVMITAEEKVKILDFGLAKAFSDDTQSIDSSQSPTLTEGMTRPGVILGTAAYMSPEQAKGKSVNKRADIWAFGCILYECLTGKRAFEGETVTEMLAAVLKSEPYWNGLPANTPQNIRFVLHRCLAKDKEKRFQSAADVQILVEENGNSFPDVGTAARSTGWKQGAVFILIALVLIAIGLTAGWILKPSATLQSTVRFTLPDAANIYSPWYCEGYYRQFALSSRGQKLVFVYKDEEQSCLALRSLDSTAITILGNTDGATSPFWSPDNESIAFFTSSALKKITLATGTVETICPFGGSMGGSWGEKGEIVVANWGGVWLVPASGGTPKLLVETNGNTEEWAFPSFIDNGLHLLCSHWTKNEGWTVDVLSTDGNDSKPLIRAHVAEVVGDVLIFLRPGGLFSQPFDNKAMEPNGTETLLYTGDDSQGYLVGFALSKTGILVYQRRASAQLQWYSRNGQPGEVLELPPSCRDPELSPDGKLLAVECSEPDISPIDVIALRDIYIYDLERNSPVKVPGDQGSESDPAWSPDGTQILFSLDAFDGRGPNIYRTDPSGSEFECVLDSPGNQWVMSWWPGKHLVYINDGDVESHGLYMLEGSEPKKIETYTGHGQLPPSSDVLLYDSNETGQIQIYAKSLTDSSKKWNISVRGGHKPRWRSDGKEIFYLSPDRTLMAVPVSWGKGFEPGTATPLFKTRIAGSLFTGMRSPYAVTRDGQRFLMYVGEPSSSLTIVTNAVSQ